MFAKLPSENEELLRLYMYRNLRRYREALNRPLPPAAGSGGGISGLPGAPTGLTVTIVSTTALDLSWTAPSDPGETAITGYQIEVNSGSGWSVLVADTGNTNVTYSDTGLTANTNYTYRISAINSIGTGDTSSSASAYTFFDVASLSTDLWLDATIPGSISATGTRLDIWTDQSSNAYTFSNTVDAEKPTTGIRTINGRNVVDANDTNAWLWEDDPITGGMVNFWAGGAEVYAVVNIDSDGEADLGVLIRTGGNPLNGGWNIRTTNETGGTVTLELRVSGWSTTAGNWEISGVSLGEHIITIRYNSDSTANDPVILIDGVSQTVTETSTPAGTYQTDSGGELQILNTNGIRNFDGALGEMICVPTLTAQQQTDLIRSLQDKWGT